VPLKIDDLCAVNTGVTVRPYYSVLAFTLLALLRPAIAAPLDPQFVHLIVDANGYTLEGHRFRDTTRLRAQLEQIGRRKPRPFVAIDAGNGTPPEALTPYIELCADAGVPAIAVGFITEPTGH
jgi:hypothetical protein